MTSPLAPTPKGPISWLYKSLFALSTTLYHIFFSLHELLFLLFRCTELLPSMFRLWERGLARHRSPWRAYLQGPAHGREQSDPELTYGEMSLPTVDKVLKRCGLTSQDTLYDLGAGRGKVVMLAAARGIRAHGIELLPLLTELARECSQDLLPLASFSCEDLLDADLSPASAFWLSGCCLNETTRQTLANTIAAMPHGTKLISVTSPLIHPKLRLQQVLPGWTSWGSDRFFLQIVDDPPTQGTTL